MTSWTAVWLADPLDGGTATSIPGENAFKGIVAALVPWALAACVAVIIIGAILWAVGHTTERPGHSSKGKTAIVIAVVAAVIVAAAGVLVDWGKGVGDTVSAPASMATVSR